MEFTVEVSEIIRNYLIAVVAVIGFPLAIWRSYISYKNSVIATKNHLTDTYTKAIEHIGHSDKTCVLGGLFALEKIAYQNEDYHHQIMELMCAFIRFNQPNHDDKGNKKETVLGGQQTSITVQVALDIICRRNMKFEKNKKLIINLAKSGDIIPIY